MGHNFEVKQFGDIILMFCYRCGRTYRLYATSSWQRWEDVRFDRTVPVSECETEDEMGEDETMEGQS